MHRPSVGVVGAGKVGSVLAASLRAVEACGGTTIVQDPDDAAEPEMPRSALAHVAVDHVLRLDAIAGALNALSRPLDIPRRIRTRDSLRAVHATSLETSDMRRPTTPGPPLH
jgi:two-component system chemotaxis response regulator CheB